jgi:hypothetical protein
MATKYISGKCCKDVVTYQSNGHSVSEICVIWGVCKDTFYEWKKKYPEFDKACEIARLAMRAYFDRIGRENLVVDRSVKFNENLYKFLCYAHFGISEKSTDARQTLAIHADYYKKETTIDQKQMLLDNALINGKISSAIYDSLANQLRSQFDRENAFKILEAEQKLREFKETK